MRLRSSAGVWYGLLYLAVSLASSWPIFLGYVPLPGRVDHRLAALGRAPGPGHVSPVRRDGRPGQVVLPGPPADRRGDPQRHDPALEPVRPERLPDARRAGDGGLRAADDAVVRAADRPGLDDRDGGAAGRGGAGDGAVRPSARARARRRPDRRLRVRLVRLPGRLGRAGDGRRLDVAALGAARGGARRRGADACEDRPDGRRAGVRRRCRATRRSRRTWR